MARCLPAAVFALQLLLTSPLTAAAGAVDEGRSVDFEVWIATEAAVTDYAYRNYSAIRSDLVAIADRHGDIAMLVDIGDSWETSQGMSDRDILALKISDNVATEEDEPKVLFLGLHHAREWPTSEIVLELAENITSAYGNDTRISWLVDNREIWLLPVVNPDGLDYALSVDEFWRKNRRDNLDGMYGVDLNRNYNGSENGDPAGAWGGVGTSFNTSSDVYCGLGPFSEPETQAVRDLALLHEFELAIDFHTYSDLVLWPWGYTGSPAPDDAHLVRIGHELASLNGYTPQQSYDLYPTTGDSVDWLYGRTGAFAYCIEVGNEGGALAERYHPMNPVVVQGLIDENLPAALELIESAGDREERAFQISHVPLSVVNYSVAGHEVRAEITADRGVNVSSPRVYYRLAGGQWHSLPMVLAEANDTYAATIPSQSGGSTVEYYISTRDLGDVELIEPRYAPYDVHSFLVTAAQVDDPPVITHQPRNETDTGDTSYDALGWLTIWATVDDDVALSRVWLMERPFGSSENFTGSDMISTYGNEIYGVSSTNELGRSLEYYIEAIDSIGQVSKVPADAPSSFHVWYNTAPEVISFVPPGSPPGTVFIDGSVNLSIECRDDYAVCSVVANVTWPSGVTQDLVLERASGTMEAGIWSTPLNVGSELGTIVVSFTVSDGPARTYLNGSDLTVLDPTPLEVSFVPPVFVEGSTPVLFTAVASNMSVGTALEVRIADADTGAILTLLMADSGGGTHSASVGGGELEGSYVVYVVARLDGEMIWSSGLHSLLVEDLTAPVLDASSATLTSGGMVRFNLSGSDAYGIETGTLFYRPFGEDAFLQSAMSLIGGTPKNGRWSCDVAEAIYTGFDYYFEASDGSQVSRLPADGAILTFNVPDDGGENRQDGDDSDSAMLWLFGEIAVAAAVALAVLLLIRARRS